MLYKPAFFRSGAGRQTRIVPFCLRQHKMPATDFSSSSNGLCREIAQPIKQAPGPKENSPGRKPGVGSESSAKPWATEKCCEPMPFAPAGAPQIQYPIRGLAPPATISWPLWGIGIRVEPRISPHQLNRVSRCLEPHSRDTVFDWFSGKPAPGGGRYDPLFLPGSSFDTGLPQWENSLMANKSILYNHLQQ